MPDLSACYFCGTALDEPLSEYPVVPKTLHPSPDQQGTVVLCSACRRKLGKVVDSILDAVDDASLEDTIQQDLPGGSVGASASGDTVNAADGDPASGDGPNDATGGVGTTEEEGSRAQEATARADREDATSDRDDDETKDTVVDEDPPGEDDATGGTSDVDEDPDGAFDISPPPEGEGGASEEGSTPATSREHAADGSGDEDEEPSLSALEYTNVMRLLENRELPVDREEIRVVATNAYEIRPEEFDSVVEAAIDRGLIVEEDGEFVDIE